MEHENFRISKIHICSFDKEKESDNFFKLDVYKYPVRICVIDEKKGIAIDVVTKHQYPYVRIINMSYSTDEQGLEEVTRGKRAACIEYHLFPHLELNSEILEKCNEVIKLLKNGFKFPDGNLELTNEEYLNLIDQQKTEENNKKIRKKCKKRK